MRGRGCVAGVVAAVVVLWWLSTSGGTSTDRTCQRARVEPVARWYLPPLPATTRANPSEQVYQTCRRKILDKYSFADGCRGLSAADVAYTIHDPGKPDTPGQSLLQQLMQSQPAYNEVAGTLELWRPSDRWPSTNRTTRVSSNVGSSNENAMPYAQCRSRNAFIAFAAGYKSDVLLKLIAEFQSVHLFCDVLVLFVYEKPPDLWLEDDGTAAAIQFELFNAYAHVIPEDLRSDTPGQMRNNWDVVTWLRVLIFSEWLAVHWQEYAYVVVSDTRDVFIQGNVFAPLYRMSLDGLFSVKEQIELKEKSVNHHWMSKCFGKRYTNFVRKATVPPLSNGGKYWARSGVSFPVLCNGIVGGTAAAMVDYFAVYRRVVMARGTNRDCKDQATHIFLQMTMLPRIGFPHKVHVLHDKVGPFRHVYVNEVARRDRRGRHINCIQQPYSIVHQLDRDEVLWHEARQSTTHFASGAGASTTEQFFDTPAYKLRQLCV